MPEVIRNTCITEYQCVGPMLTCYQNILTSFRWSAICRGATRRGLEHLDAMHTSPGRTNLTVTSRLSRYSYGYSVMLPFERDKHLISDLYHDPVEGVNKANNQMRWLLKRVRHNVCKWFEAILTQFQGQEIKDGAELEASVYHSVQVGFWDSGQRPFEKTLLFSADEIPPTRVTECKSTNLLPYLI